MGQRMVRRALSNAMPSSVSVRGAAAPVVRTWRRFREAFIAALPIAGKSGADHPRLTLDLDQGSRLLP